VTALTNIFRLRPELKNVRLAGSKPKTSDEINAEHDRYEYDLRTDYQARLADSCRWYYERLENLRMARAAELAKVEKGEDKSGAAVIGIGKSGWKSGHN